LYKYITDYTVVRGMESVVTKEHQQPVVFYTLPSTTPLHLCFVRTRCVADPVGTHKIYV
jgi:hypothetical protein